MPTKLNPIGCVHGNVSYRFFNMAAIQLEIYLPGFGFRDDTRLTMSKSLSTPNFDKIAQSTFVLILLLIRENGHPSYFNYTSGFQFTY